MKEILMFVLVFCFSFIAAQNYREKYAKKTSSDLAFYFDLVNLERNDSVSTKVDVFIQVPFSKVKFIKADDGFHAEYSMTVGIYENESTMITERTWVEKLKVQTFVETMSRKNFNISRKSFALRPGKYTVKMMLEDKDSKQSYITEGSLSVRIFDQSITCSDPILLEQTTANDSRIIPNIAHIVHTKDSTFNFYSVVTSKMQTTVRFMYNILSSNNKIVATKTELKVLPEGKTQLIARMDSIALAAGEYLLQINIADTAGNKIFENQRGFTTRLSGLPLMISNLDKAVEQLIYIATPSEMDSLKKAKTYDEKLSHFLAFWKKKDRNEATEENEIFTEYYTRIEYANRNFSTYMEGWKTDMGMVVIYLGLPSNIDRHPFDYDSKPYEIWEYYELNRRFVFYDYSGFGDYRLSSPFPGDLYKFQ